MSVDSFLREDLAAQQSAFTGLLAHPLVAPWTFPDLFALVSRHQHRLDQWCRRLGYRIVRIDQCFRLRRVPLGGQPAIPRSTPPARRTLVLALLAAAILEDEHQDSVTLQDMSDAVRRFASVNDFRDYDPQQRRHRVELVEAVRFLCAWGVLEQRTRRADLIDTWEREGAGIGAGYVIHRDALVLLVDTRDAELALDADIAAADDTRGARLLRQLVETQSLETQRLSDDERAYLVSQRRRLCDQAEEMTGGTVEIRSDAWVLVFPADRGLEGDLLVSFPAPTAVDWAALALLDKTSRSAVKTAGDPRAPAHRDAVPASSGRRRVRGLVVDTLVAALHRNQGSHLTVALRESPAALRHAVESRLVEAGLLEVDGADWVLLPAAGRYRSATLERLPDDATTAPGGPTLFEEET